MRQAQLYGLFCPATGELRYIGKARNAASRLKSHLRDSKRRSTPLYLWMRRLGRSPVMRVLLESWDWPESERELIGQYRSDGADLLNVAPGGNEPHCQIGVRQANGRRNAAAIHRDPFRRRVWELNRRVGASLRRGEFTERQKAKIRRAAQKRPDLFGQWRTI